MVLWGSGDTRGGGVCATNVGIRLCESRDRRVPEIETKIFEVKESRLR